MHKVQQIFVTTNTEMVPASNGFSLLVEWTKVLLSIGKDISFPYLDSNTVYDSGSDRAKYL